jgi:hypothetical protein
VKKTRILIKVGMGLILLGLVFTANAEFKSGVEMVGRMETYTMKTTWDADTQTMKRYTDMRLRPWFSYEANKNLSAQFLFEIGDIPFGNKDKGGAQGADQNIIELKNAYLDIQFTEKQNIAPIHDAKLRFGIMGHKDAQSLILEDDLAGIKYMGRYNQLYYDIAYYLPNEGDGEKNINTTTYSFAERLINVDASYKITPKMTAGLYTLISMNKTAADDKAVGYVDGDEDLVNKNSNNTWLSPYFKGDFGMVSVDAMLSYNMRSAEYEAVGKDVDVEETEKDALSESSENGAGMVISLKSVIKATKALSFGVNVAYAPGDEDGVDYWQPYKNKYKNGTEMIGYGINDFSSYQLINTKVYGIMLPALTADFKVSDNISVGGAFGMAMTTVDVEFTDSDGNDQKETNLGTEISLKSKIKVFEKLTVEPYFAMFMPGPATTKGSDTEDSQMRVGLVSKIKF